MTPDELHATALRVEELLRMMNDGDQEAGGRFANGMTILSICLARLMLRESTDAKRLENCIGRVAMSLYDLTADGVRADVMKGGGPI